jgi:hypothetical protein
MKRETKRIFLVDCLEKENAWPLARLCCYYLGFRMGKETSKEKLKVVESGQDRIKAGMAVTVSLPKIR